MSSILKNWMTTLPGIVTLIGVIYNAYQTKTIDWSHLQGALVAVGLVAAKDFNVTGGNK
jgi:hypothetical protein